MTLGEAVPVRIDPAWLTLIHEARAGTVGLDRGERGALVNTVARHVVA